MYKIELKTTLQMVRDSKPKMVFYGANTCWWTTNPEDLGTTQPRNDRFMGELLPDPGGIPCDPRGGVLFQTENVENFLDTAEANAKHYGPNGLDAFMAAYHGNLMAKSNTNPDADWKPWCFASWGEYNVVLDEDKLKSQ